MSQRRCKGFSLVELLVAVGITAVLAAVLLALVARTMTLWERSASALTLENEAALILDHLGADIETAFRDVALDDAEWIAFTEDGDSLETLRLMVAAAPTASGSNLPNTLREVTYQMQTTTGGGNLSRLERSAAATLAARYVWAIWPTVPAAEFLLAERIDQLRITFWDGARQELLAVTQDSWPVLAQVQLILLTPDGAARLEAVNAGRSNEDVAQLRAETTRTFVRWVTVGGQIR